MASRNLTDNQKKIEKNIEAGMQLAIAYAAPEVPSLANLTPQGLNEDFGRINSARKALEKTEAIIKERLKSQYDFAKGPLRSDNFTTTIKSQERTALNQGLAKEKLTEIGGPQLLAECMATSEVPTMTVKEN